MLTGSMALDHYAPAPDDPDIDIVLTLLLKDLKHFLQIFGKETSSARRRTRSRTLPPVLPFQHHPQRQPHQNRFHDPEAPSSPAEFFERRQRSRSAKVVPLWIVSREASSSRSSLSHQSQSERQLFRPGAPTLGRAHHKIRIEEFFHRQDAKFAKSNGWEFGF